MTIDGQAMTDTGAERRTALDALVTVTDLVPHHVASGSPSKGVKKIVHVPLVLAPDGSFDRATMREFVRVAFGDDVARTARWYRHASLPRTDVMTSAVTDWLGDPAPGWLVDRRSVEASLDARGIERVRETYAVTVAGTIDRPRAYYRISRIGRRDREATALRPFVEVDVPEIRLPSSVEPDWDAMRAVLAQVIDADLADVAIAFESPAAERNGRRCFALHRWSTADEARRATHGITALHAPNGHGFNRWVALHGVEREIEDASTIVGVGLERWTSGVVSLETFRAAEGGRRDREAADRAPRRRAPGVRSRRTTSPPARS